MVVGADGEGRTSTALVARSRGKILRWKMEASVPLNNKDLFILGRKTWPRCPTVCVAKPDLSTSSWCGERGRGV